MCTSDCCMVKIQIREALTPQALLLRFCRSLLLFVVCPSIMRSRREWLASVRPWLIFCTNDVSLLTFCMKIAAKWNMFSLLQLVILVVSYINTYNTYYAYYTPYYTSLETRHVSYTGHLCCGFDSRPHTANHCHQNAKLEPKMHHGSHAAPNECIGALKNNNCNQAAILTWCQKVSLWACKKIGEKFCWSFGAQVCLFWPKVEVPTPSFLCWGC